MGRVTRRSVAAKEETPKESPKSGGKRATKKDKPAGDDNSEGDSQETPKRSGRKTVKEEQKNVPAKGRQGRSTSRGGRGKKEEETESAEAEIEEEKPQRGSTRSRGKGKAAQEVKTARSSSRQNVRSGRGAKKVEEDDDVGDEDDENADKEDEEKEANENNVHVKGSGRGKGKGVGATPSRGDRKGRGKSTAESEAEDKVDEDSTESQGKDVEQSKSVDTEVDAAPKGRQRRSVNKEASEVSPSSGLGKGKNQKSTPKVTAAGRSSRRSGVAVTTNETSENKDDETEQMDTGDVETVVSKTSQVEESAITEKAAEDKEESATSENSLVENEKTSTTEQTAVEKDDSTATEDAVAIKEPVKEKEESTTEKTAVEKEESPDAVEKAALATEEAAPEKAAVEMEELLDAEEKDASPTEKTAEKKELSPTEKTAEKKESSPTENAKVEEDESSLIEKAALQKEESADVDKAAVEKEESPATEKSAMEIEESQTSEKAATEKEQIASDVVEELSDTNVSKKRKLDDEEDNESSKPTSPNKKRKLEDDDAAKDDTDKQSQEDVNMLEDNRDNHTTSETTEVTSLPLEAPSKSLENTSSDNTEQEAILKQPKVETPSAPIETELENQKEPSPTIDTSSKVPSDVPSVELSTNGAKSSDSDNSAEQVKQPADSITCPDQNGISHEQNTVPVATEPHSEPNNSSGTLAASQSQTSPDSNGDQPAEPSPELMEIQSEEPSLKNASTNNTDHLTLHPSQNGTDGESADAHITSSPDKSHLTVSKTYVPSSTSIDRRKFISNPAFPVELMDPAYCFSVVSYNILADCHLCRGDYSYTQPQYLVQDYRHSLVLKEFDYLDGDIVCLQEVSPSYYTETLLPAMKSRGYDGHFSKRTKEYWDEGEATFVKTSKFDIVSHQSVSLKDLAFKEVDNSGLGEDLNSAIKKYLDRADIILLTELQCKKTTKKLTVCNIHVVHDVKAPDVQCIQVACAIKQLVVTAGSDFNPHIICGDFNSDVASPVYQLTRDGYLSDDHILRLQSLDPLESTDGTSRTLIHHVWGAFQHTSSTLKNAYELALGKEPPVTVFTKSKKSVDHIFHSSASIDNVGVLETLDVEVLEASGGLPSKNIPSDHLSIKAVFRLKD